MSVQVEQSVVEHLRLLPPEKQQEVLDFVEFPAQRGGTETLTARPRCSLLGLCADLGIDIDADEIDNARREMWRNFPRDDISVPSVVVDTHVVIWYLTDPVRLSNAARGAVEHAALAGDQVFVPAICLVELRYLIDRGRLPEIIMERLVAAGCLSGRDPLTSMWRAQSARSPVARS